MGNCLIVNKGDSYKEDLLWTNPSPTSEFSAQQLDVSLSGYDYVKIEHRFNINDSSEGVPNTANVYFKVSDLPTSSSRNTSSVYALGASYGGRGRGVFYNDNKLGFKDCYKWTDIENKICVPQKIYGIKGHAIPYKFPTDETLLWTNSSPNSSYTTGSISLNLNNYNLIKLVIRKSTSDATEASYLFNVDDLSTGDSFNFSFGDDYWNCSRRISYKNSTIAITKNYATERAEANGTSIPIRIYGVGKKA